MKNILLIIIILLATIGLFAQKATMVYPKTNQVVSDSTILFMWDEIPNTSSYNLQIALDSFFQNIVLDSNTFRNKLAITVDSNISTTYFVRVNGLKNNQLSNWSNVVVFNVFNLNMFDDISLILDAQNNVVVDAQNNVDYWYDCRDSSLYTYPDNIAKSPLYKDSSYLSFKSIKFNGIQSLYFNYLIADSISKTVFITYKRNNFPSNQIVLLYESSISYIAAQKNNTTSKKATTQIDGSSVIYSTNNECDNFQVLTAINNSNNTRIGINNLFGSSLSTSGDWNFSKIGHYNSSSYNFEGEIMDIILFTKPLDSIEIELVNKYLLDKYTPPINLGANILRTYGFCDTILRTKEMYESYVWNTGETTREISIAKEDTGWYWCDVPDLYGEIMRDSVYVYDFVGATTLRDTLICINDSISIVGINSSIINSVGYSYVWQNSIGDTLSTDSAIFIGLSGKYYLQISDTNGCYITDNMQLFVDSFPIQASLGSDQSLCTGNKIGLTAGQAEADSFLWSNASGDSLIEIYTAGTYSLIVRDTLNCVAKDTILIDIHGVTPMVSFMADTVCFKDSSLFVDASQSLDASNLISWTWDFADNSSPLNLSTSNPFNHLLPDSGSYKVKLTVSTDSNCTNYTYKDIYIRPLPQPNFYPLTACENHELNFENLSAPIGGEILTYYWGFGTIDTAISHPSFNNGGLTYTYTQEGDFNATLKADNIYGCSDSIIKTINIKPSPEADFNNSVSCEGVDISFADNSTTLSYLPINAWNWIFDTTLASTSTLSSPTHHFDTAGFYPVNLKVTSINGCWDTLTKMVQLHAIPEANFSNDTACINSAVNFTDISLIEDGNINYHYWLQDGIAFSADQNSSFVFGDTLEHDIVLKVRTVALCEDSISRIVKVHPLPIAAFTTDRVYGLAPITVGFINESSSSSTTISSSTLTYQWFFGDGGNSYDENPLHTYNDSAVFYPKLYAFNKFGCLDSTSGVIYAVYSAVDVSVSQIKAEIKDGYISYSCRITNLGKQKLTQLELSAKYNSGLAISEQWQGELHTGEFMDYMFSSRSQIPSGDQIQYFCIEAEVTQTTDQEDENPDNNSVCDDISTNFWVSTLYPNPATNEINIDIILPYSQTMEIELIDLSGKVLRSSSLNGQKGLNNIKLPVNTLPSAQYRIQIITNDAREVRGFVK